MPDPRQGKRGHLAEELRATISFFVPGLPTAQGRPRSFAIRKGGALTGKIGHYMPKDSSSWLAQIREAARQAHNGGALITGPVTLTVDCLMPMPKALSNRVRGAVMSGDIVPHTKKPDGDNLEAVVLNALKGVIWHDDAQVWDHRTRKFYGDPPGVRITLMELCDD